MPFMLYRKAYTSPDNPWKWPWEANLMQREAFQNIGGIEDFLHEAEPAQNNEAVAKESSRRRGEQPLNPAASYTTIIDANANDRIVALAIWEIYPDAMTQSQVEELARSPPLAPGANPQAWEDYFGYLAEQRQRLGTKPIAILKSIATHPEYQRRGAGAMLMEAFVEAVDQTGVEGYLEASEVGQNLYAKFGFEPASMKVFDLEKYGGSGSDSTTIMTRPAKSKVSAS